MDITEFFQQSSGKWFSQRTSHYLASRKSESGKADIWIEALANNDPDVVKLCNQHGVDPALVSGGLRVTWSGPLEDDKEKPIGATVLVPLTDSSNPHEGKLLYRAGDAEAVPAAGRYVMGSGDALTLITEDNRGYSEERLWFASPNLRMRTSILKQANGFSVASFCTEIRMGGAQPPKDSPTGANRSL